MVTLLISLYQCDEVRTYSTCDRLQMCRDILESLRCGDFGKCDESAVDFKDRCHELYPYAAAFSPPVDNAVDNAVDNTVDNAVDLKMTKVNNIDEADSANILLNGTEP